jgi:hypothetical protein
VYLVLGESEVSYRSFSFFSMIFSYYLGIATMIRSEREEERESSLAFLALGVAHCGAVLGYQTGSECSMMTRAIKPELQLDIPDSLKLWQRDKIK